MGYLIAYDCLVNGESTILYHEKVQLNPDPTAMNVYTECLTNDQENSREFHSLEEAQGIASLFENKIKIPFIINS